MSINLWNKTSVYRGKHISIIEQEFTRGQKEGKYEVVIRNNISSIVSVLPITIDDEIILIRQFRIPLGRYIIEQPAGLNDKAGETDIETAKRELLEETWYTSEDLEYMITVPTSSGLTNELVSCYIARNCQKVSENLNLDDSECISVFTLPIDTAFEYLFEETRKGNFVDSKVFMMLQLYKSSIQ